MPAMHRTFRLLLLLPALLGLQALVAQEARVRAAPRVSMPTTVDSNSPAFWREGRLFWFGSHGRPWLSEGPNQFGPWETREIDLQTANAWPHWMEAVWPAEDGVLWGWYHAEPVGLVADSTLTAPKIGAVVSFDGGNTLQDLGIILESGDRLDAWAQNGYFAGGHGDFSVILDRERRYFYFFFDNYGGPAATQGVCVARMAYDDRANPVGRVWKYCDGQWLEAGVGGRMTPIFPVTRRWQSRDPDALWGPSIHWNTHLNCFVMLLNRAQGEPGWSQEGVYVSFSSDLSRPDSWSVPQKILDRNEFPGWYFFYPQVMGLEAGGTDREAGGTARLYVGGISKWEIDFIAPPRAPFAVQANSEPASPAVTAGQDVTLRVTAAGTGPLAYQWLKDGVAIPGATTATYTLAGAAAADAGSYVAQVGNHLGTAVSNPITVVVVMPRPPPETFLSNFSVRARLTEGTGVLTVGFVVRDSAPKRLLMRAVGPSLGLFGVAEAESDPGFELFGAAGESLGGNGDWQLNAAGVFAEVAAFPLLPGSADAALPAELPPGAGTMQVMGRSGGVVLAEIYDPAPGRWSKLLNLSARGTVGQGEAVLIAGVGLKGTATKRLLIRALGPGLGAFGVEGGLANPTLEVSAPDGTLLASNDDWESTLEDGFAAAGAAALAPGSRDAALVVTLAGEARCTLTVRSADDTSGEVLLEVFELP